MSVEAKVRTLESLLERIEERRRPLEALGAAPSVEADEPMVSIESPSPTPDTPIGAVVEASKARPRSATPMEQALSVELEVEEPSIEITVDDDDDDEPIITIEPGPPDEIDLDSVPTAPVGTPAVPSAAAGPARIEVATPRPSGPVAKVVSRAEPRTFGELLDRTLALRPR